MHRADAPVGELIEEINHGSDYKLSRNEAAITSGGVSVASV
jgi:hypothetical protein